MIGKPRTFLAALVLTAAPTLPLPAAAGDTYTVDKVHSEVLFTIKHLMSRVTGKFQDFSASIQIDRAKPENSSVEVTIKTASINTSETKRDDHLRSPDFFDAAKYPEITFKSSKIAAKSKDAFEVAGTLTIRGVSKPVTLPVTFLGDLKDPWGNERSGFEVTTTLNRKDYGILWNKALDQGGFVLGDEVKVTINLEAVKQKQAADAK